MNVCPRASWPLPRPTLFLQELAARQEKIRRETIELEAQLRQKTELERVKMETEGRILAERKNHDLRLEQVCTCDVQNAPERTAGAHIGRGSTPPSVVTPRLGRLAGRSGGCGPVGQTTETILGRKKKKKYQLVLAELFLHYYL